MNYRRTPPKKKGSILNNLKVICHIVLIVYVINGYGNKNTADLSLNIGLNQSVCFPIYSLSIGWLSENRFKEIGTEFSPSNSLKDGEHFFTEFGLSYAHLFKAYPTFLFLGPIFSWVAIEKNKSGFVSDSQRVKDFSGIYLLGVKAMLIPGTDKLKIKIDNRILLGFEKNGIINSAFKLSYLFTVSIGLIYVY